MTLTVRDGKLVARTGGPAYTLVAVAPNRFRLTGGPAGFRSEAEFDSAGGARAPIRVTTTYDDGDVEKETYAPIQRWAPSPAELQKLAGKYASAELDTTWRLAEESGKLYIRHRGMPDKPLEPTVADAFTLDGMNLSSRGTPPGTRGLRPRRGRVRGSSSWPILVGFLDSWPRGDIARKKRRFLVDFTCRAPIALGSRRVSPTGIFVRSIRFAESRHVLTATGSSEGKRIAVRGQVVAPSGSPRSSRG